MRSMVTHALDLRPTRGALGDLDITIPTRSRRARPRRQARADNPAQSRELILRLVTMRPAHPALGIGRLDAEEH
jgi:hypothetical protein